MAVATRYVRSSKFTNLDTYACLSETSVNVCEIMLGGLKISDVSPFCVVRHEVSLRLPTNNIDHTPLLNSATQRMTNAQHQTLSTRHGLLPLVWRAVCLFVNIVCSLCVSVLLFHIDVQLNGFTVHNCIISSNSRAFMNGI